MLKRTFTSLFACVFSLIVFAQNYEWKTETSNGYTYRYVSNDPLKARFYTLKNGLTVILSPTPKDPRIQCYVAVKAGSKTDPSTNTGLAHYLEHMMFKGTDKYGTLDWEKEKPQLDKIDALYEEYNKTKDPKKRKEIYKQIDNVSGIASQSSIANEYDKMMTSMGAQGTNAFTSFEKTVYTDDVPSSSIDKYLAVQAERFRNPILRIFHTELEAVYEEKNKSLDSDNDRASEILFANLFKNHNYGKQTILGTVEHLKNPSLVQIRKYFQTYYVPNNMGIVLSGDFNPDEVIKKIDEKFGSMKEGAVPKYTFEPEAPITKPVNLEVTGPDAANLTMAFRLPGNKHKDAILANLVSQILANGNAGLIDLNLLQKQKLLGAEAESFSLIDYGILFIAAVPTEGQSLEDAKKLILSQIENLKKGNFDDDLIPSIVNNLKKSEIQGFEKYSNRANTLMEAFTSELDWKDQVAYVNNLSKITKQQVVDFANKYLGDNYIAVFKKEGPTPRTSKIIKPQITPVETNAGKQSAFLQMISEMPSNSVKPVFLDFSKDIQRGSLGKAEVLHVQNTDNPIYRLTYRYKIGSLNDLKQDMASDYLQFLGTNQKSAEEISKEFYKIASSFSVKTGEEYTTVTIEGLQENFDKAVKLYEDLVLNAQPDEEALANLKTSLIKARSDAKFNKKAIMQGIANYAMYGSKNKFNDVLSDADIKATTSKELLERIKTLGNYEQTIAYYGPETLSSLTDKLKALHPVPTKFSVPAPAKVYNKIAQDKNQVLFTNYDMVQAETSWIQNTDAYDPSKETLVTIFNNYFGGGMGSIVFQTIRESKALAYSTSAYYITPEKKNEKYSVFAYVGSQSDKFNDAATAMNQLLTTLPEYPQNVFLAKEQAKNDIETERITQDKIIWAYLGAKEKGLDYDIRKDIYNNVDKIKFDDLKGLHKTYFSGKPYTYAVIASEKNVSKSDLSKYGELKVLSLKEIFGY